MIKVNEKYKNLLNEDFINLMNRHTSEVMRKAMKDVEEQLKRFGLCAESDEVQVVQGNGSWLYYYKKLLICTLRFMTEGYELKVLPEGIEKNLNIGEEKIEWIN